MLEVRELLILVALRQVGESVLVEELLAVAAITAVSGLTHRPDAEPGRERPGAAVVLVLRVVRAVKKETAAQGLQDVLGEVRRGADPPQRPLHRPEIARLYDGRGSRHAEHVGAEVIEVVRAELSDRARGVKPQGDETEEIGGGDLEDVGGAMRGIDERGELRLKVGRVRGRALGRGHMREKKRRERS